MTRTATTTSAVRTMFAIAGVAAITVGLGACSVGGGSSAGGPVELTMLVPATTDVDYAEALAEAFEAEHDDITIAIETRPSGTEGENVVKTRLATGEMPDVFVFNSGALLGSLSPDQSLVDLSDQSWASGLDEGFTEVVSGEQGMYGVPWGTARAGGILYNRGVYEDLGLKIPETWDEFVANNEAVAAAGITPVAQTYGDTFTAQVLVLGDFGNVLAADPEWAESYTANERRFAEQPGLASFEKLGDLAEAGVFNEDFASALYDDGIRMVAEGGVAHYPMLTNYAATNLTANYPELADEVGFFAVPTESGDEATATMWMPLAAYIPKTIDDAKLEAAEELLGFIASPAGCGIHAEVASPAGPYLVDGCELPDTAISLVDDVTAYYDEGRTALALEFLSPVKGTNLAQFAVEVGSGMRSAKDAAGLYDQDVKKQAEQLGLEGW